MTSLIYVAALLLAGVLGAQTPELEKVHAPLFTPPVVKSKEASALTASYSPAKAGLTQPVARANFIDDHVFGRMLRDRVPHAALASDEEFARRAWLDATGRIPPPGEP